jgi:hypothetical protein
MLMAILLVQLVLMVGITLKLVFMGMLILLLLMRLVVQFMLIL